jgi:hypothetical protein
MMARTANARDCALESAGDACRNASAQLVEALDSLSRAHRPRSIDLSRPVAPIKPRATAVLDGL